MSDQAKKKNSKDSKSKAKARKPIPKPSSSPSSLQSPSSSTFSSPSISYPMKSEPKSRDAIKQELARKFQDIVDIQCNSMCKIKEHQFSKMAPLSDSIILPEIQDRTKEKLVECLSHCTEKLLTELKNIEMEKKV